MHYTNSRPKLKDTHLEGFVIFIIALVGVMFFWQWRTAQAVKGMAGKTIPGQAAQRAQHPNGVLFYFYHPQCAPCRQMSVDMDKLLEGHPGRVVKINVAEERELTLAFGISSTPTTVLARDGVIAQAFVGPEPLHKLEAILG